MLIGFRPYIELEMQFTALELLYLFQAAKGHYDSACQATARHTTGLGDGRTPNGSLVKELFYMGEPGTSDSYHKWPHDKSDEEYLLTHPDLVSKVTLSWRDVDLLAKVSEQFDVEGKTEKFIADLGLPMPPPKYDKDVATRIFTGLRRALSEARCNIDLLDEQEKLRRAKLGKD